MSNQVRGFVLAAVSIVWLALNGLMWRLLNATSSSVGQLHAVNLGVLVLALVILLGGMALIFHIADGFKGKPTLEAVCFSLDEYERWVDLYHRAEAAQHCYPDREYL